MPSACEESSKCGGSAANSCECTGNPATMLVLCPVYMLEVGLLPRLACLHYGELTCHCLLCRTEEIEDQCLDVHGAAHQLLLPHKPAPDHSDTLCHGHLAEVLEHNPRYGSLACSDTSPFRLVTWYICATKGPVAFLGPVLDSVHELSKVCIAWNSVILVPNSCKNSCIIE